MDPLALLCTLHADGPATLRRLRGAGCGTLEQLSALGVQRLGELLGFSPAVARRFLREAARLGARVGVDALGREEVLHAASSGPASEALGAAPPSAPPVEAVAPRARESAARVEDLEARLGLSDRQLLRKVVDRWREADEADGPRPAPERGPEREPEVGLAAAPPAPEPTPAPGTPLLELEGADPALRARLEAEGLADVEAVAAVDPVDLARRLGLPYTRARRLQFCARRRCATAARREGRAPAAARAEPERKLSPSFRAGAAVDGEPPAALPALERPGGPFAR